MAPYDLNASARALEEALRESGMRTEPYLPYIAQLRELGKHADPITPDSATPFLPTGMLDNSLRKTGDGSYVAAIAFYPPTPMRTLSFPPQYSTLGAANTVPLSSSPSTR